MYEWTPGGLPLRFLQRVGTGASCHSIPSKLCSKNFFCEHNLNSRSTGREQFRISAGL
jgi:hypothetical protein